MVSAKPGKQLSRTFVGDKGMFFETRDNWIKHIKTNDFRGILIGHRNDIVGHPILRCFAIQKLYVTFHN